MIRKVEFSLFQLVLWIIFIVPGTRGIEISGTQAGVWTLDNSPYIINGDVVVPGGMTLTIESGVVVKFAGYFGIKVNGAIIANGNLGKRIVFTSINDNEFGLSGEPSTVLPSNKDWSGIDLTTTSNLSSTLNYCILRYCDRVISANTSNLTISHCIVADCNTPTFTINGMLISIENGVENDYFMSNRAVVPQTSVLSQQVDTRRTSAQPILTEQDNLYESLGEEFTFGEIKVISAAKREQTSVEAPAVVTVITDKEIKERGYRTLIELLRDIVGFDINDPGNWVDTGIRGVNNCVTYGKHIQYLVDGHDMGFKQFTRNYVAPSWISMSDIKRIEIIRGPGSALWGANAFLGVVNIITKDSKDLNFGITSQVGSFSSTNATVQGSKTFGADGDIYGSVSFYRDDTSPGRKILEWSQVAGKDIYLSNDKEENYTVRLKARYKEFRLKGHLERYDPYAPISTFSVGGSQSRFNTDRKYAALSWEPKFGSLTGIFELTYQNYEMGKGAQYEDNPYDKNPVSKTHQFIQSMVAKDDFIKLSAQGNYTFSSKLWAIGGIEYETLNTIRWYFPDVWEQDHLEVPKFDVQSFAVYAEAQYTLLNRVYTTFGIRHDNHSIYGGVTNPRLGLVWKLPKGFYVKTLYGEAFKAPSLHEQYYFRKNAFYGNPELRPEKINTTEILLGYQMLDIVNINFNYYYSDAKDVVSYKSRAADMPLINASSFPQTQWPDGTKSYSQQGNVDNYTLSGFEFESKFLIARQINVFFNFAINKALDATTKQRLQYSAEKFVNSGVSYNFGNLFTLTFLGRYIGDKIVPERLFTEPGYQYNPKKDETLEAPAYFVGDLVLYFPRVLTNHYNLTFKINNITNKEYYDAGREVLFAQMPRSFYATFGAKF